MAYDFPNTPTTGQLFSGYTYDGTKWALSGPSASGIGRTSFDGTVAVTVAASALTFTVKSKNAGTPSATDPVTFILPDGAGGFNTRTVTAALSITVPSTATLGTAANVPFRVWLALFDDAGTPRLAVRNNVSTVTATAGIDAPMEHLPASTTLTPANAAQVTYSTGAAVTSKFFCWVAFANFESGQTVAGTWAAAPTNVALVSDTTPRPGSVVRTASNKTSVSASISTTTLTDSTLTYSWSSLSGADPVEVSLEGYVYIRTAAINGEGSVLLRRDSTTLSTAAHTYSGATTDMLTTGHTKMLDFPNTTSAVVYKASYQNVNAALINYFMTNLIMKELMA